MNENEKFENLAAQFKAETGIWPPGKAMPVGMTPQDERMVRSEFFAYWMAHRWISVEEGLPEETIKDNCWLLCLHGDVYGGSPQVIFFDKKCGGEFPYIFSSDDHRKHFNYRDWFEITTSNRITRWRPITLPESEVK